eukprot:scaffold45539_cov51-Attheya_sp.AAC.2
MSSWPSSPVCTVGKKLLVVCTATLVVRLFIARCAQFSLDRKPEEFGGKSGEIAIRFFCCLRFLGATSKGAGSIASCFHSEFDSITFQFASFSTIDSARSNRIAEGNDHSGSHSIICQDIVVIHKSNRVNQVNRLFNIKAE